MAGVAENAAQQSGHPLNLFDLEPAVPDANTLLSLKLLKEANPAAFTGLATDSTKWLAASLSLVRNDDYLRVKFGGDNINAAMQLAPIIKRRVEEKHIQARMDQMADGMLKATFDNEIGNMNSFEPVGLPGVLPNLAAAGGGGRAMVGKQPAVPAGALPFQPAKIQFKLRRAQGNAIIRI